MASDDGFREIQLSGKQLVFLFMATTIVAVVIFLCGVMVGRGVKAPAAAAAAANAAAPMPDAPAETQAAPGGDQLAPGNAATPAAARVEPPAEDKSPAGKAADDKTANAAPPAEPPPAVPDEPPAKTAPAAVQTAASGEPAGDGWVVQVAALADQAQASAIAAQLISKGYAAYVTVPPPGGSMYRVRVGKFKERREADRVMSRLKKEEEQFKPWITR